MNIKMLTVDEVAEILNLHRVTVQQMAIDGRITAVKIGRDWRFRPDIIEEITRKGLKEIEVGKDGRQTK